MSKLRFAISGLVVALALTIGAAALWAQQQRLSPHETISRVVDGNRVTIVYGRPYTKSPRTGEMRTIWGGLVPWDKVWRTGADEATLMITQQPLMFGDVEVPAGAYTIFTLPKEEGPSKLIINKQLGQWGLQYDEKQDLARVDLTKSSVDEPVHQFTMGIESNPDGGGAITLTWENTRYTAPFTVKKQATPGQ